LVTNGIDPSVASGRDGWAAARAHLTAADRVRSLGLDDLERLATAAYLVGSDDESLDVWTRAHRMALDAGEVGRAVRSGFWLGFVLLNKGDVARGGGWVDRSLRLLTDRAHEGVERGYIRYLAALRSIFEGDAPAAYAGFCDAGATGDTYGDSQLIALARVGEGRCLVYLGDVQKGLALLDEAMVAVTASEVSPIAVGDLYCTVIDACQELFDLKRAQEWTTALSDWCDSQPDMVLYRGQCLIHRTEVMHLHGQWPDAMREIDLACTRLADPPGQGSMGAAWYLRGDLHRVRGRFAEAEQAYARASDLGRDPQPGLALLRLAQGRPDAALASIARVLGETEPPPARARLLAPCVEITLAAAAVTDARAAADELLSIAAALDVPLLHAISSGCEGAVLLAEGEASAASVQLRRSCALWGEIDAPYELARARVLEGLACARLGDEDSARLEFDAAGRVFQRLGAVSDLLRLDELRGTKGTAPGGLTGREVEVLVLVASGRTNRAIAEQLVISEKTVARHVSNILTKLGLASRTAATAYAYEHHLVEAGS
jgi:DNA-binding CsgD family transcriptional regulator